MYVMLYKEKVRARDKAGLDCNKMELNTMLHVDRKLRSPANSGVDLSRAKLRYFCPELCTRPVKSSTLGWKKRNINVTTRNNLTRTGEHTKIPVVTVTEIEIGETLRPLKREEEKQTGKRKKTVSE